MTLLEILRQLAAFLRGLWTRIRAFLLPRSAERELDEEIRLHLELETRKWMDRGLSPGEARRRAHIDFGGVERFKERTRHVRSLPVMEEWIRDLRFAARRLWSRRAHSLAVVGTLALGIGATTAIVSVLDTVLLEPVPFPAPDRLVVVWETDRDSGTEHEPASWPDIVDFDERSRSLESVGAMTGTTITVLEGEIPERVRAVALTPSILEILDVEPLEGRIFALGEGAASGPYPSVILSEEYWRSRFAADPGLVGRSIALAGGSATVVGVLPADADLGFRQIQIQADYGSLVGEEEVDLWLPLQPTAEVYPRATHPFFTLARLADGRSLDGARAELATIAADLEEDHPENSARGVRIEPFTDAVFGAARSSLLLLFGAVGLLLVVACVNVANLLLAETADRRQEVALRRAFGAERGRIGKQFLAESLVLTFLGAAAGVGLAYGVLDLLLAIAPGDLPRLDAVRLDGRVLAFTAGLSGVVAVVFGLLPALQSDSADLQESLKSGGGGSARGGTQGRSLRRRRSGLVVAQVAMAVVLVVGAGILLRSFWELEGVDPGFRTDEVVKAEYALPDRYADFAEVVEIHSEFLAEARTIPGVESAALAVNHPLDDGFTNSFVIVGREAESAGYPEIRTRFMSPGYPEVMGVPILEGRSLTDGDVSGSPNVLVINETGAERYFPGGTAVGQQLRFWGITWRVVGVMGDERFRGIDQPVDPAVYAPIWQIPMNQVSLLLRTSRTAADVAADAGRILRAVDPEIVVTGVEPLEAVLRESLSRPRFLMTLLGSFAAVALLMALIGVYGTLSYAVARRAPEVGIRLALGATRRDVFRHVVVDGFRLTGWGVVLGAAAALAASRVLEGIVFGVTTRDMPTYLGVVAIVLLCATLASILPAVRAARQDPVRLLRAE